MRLKITNTHVIGAGAMGHGIAQVFAQAGCNVIISDINEEILRMAKSHVETNLNFLVQYEMVQADSIPTILDRIKTVKSQDEVPTGVDFVIEAVPEDRLDLIARECVELVAHTGGDEIDLVIDVPVLKAVSTFAVFLCRARGFMDALGHEGIIHGVACLSGLRFIAVLHPHQAQTLGGHGGAGGGAIAGMEN